MLLMQQDLKTKLDTFFSKYRSQKYKAGEVLIQADEEPSGIFYLTDGVVRRYAISQNGEELTLNLYKPISFFPMSWVLNGTISSHYFEALNDVTVWKAPKEEMYKFVEANPDITFDLLRRVFSGLEGMFMRMEYLLAGNANARLIVELLIYAKRFGEKDKDTTIVRLKLTEKEIASESGMARETVSRELHKLINRGLIDYDKNTLIIPNLKKLEDELQ